MTLLRNRGTGQTVGTAVSIVNSDDFGESKFQFVSSSPAPVYDNAHVIAGQTMAFKLVPTSGANCFVQYGGSTGPIGASNMAVDFWVYRTAMPVAEYTLFNGTTSAGGRRLNVNMTTAGLLKIRDETATYLFTFTNPIALNAWNHIKIYSQANGAGASTLKMALYNETNVLVEEQTSTTATRIDPIDAAVFGKTGTDTTTGTFWLADIQVDTNATSYIGDALPEIKVTQSTQVSIDASASTGFSGALTISQVSGEIGTATSAGTNKWLVSVPSTDGAMWRISGTRIGGGVSTFDVYVTKGAVSARGPKRPVGTLPSMTWT